MYIVKLYWLYLLYLFVFDCILTECVDSETDRKWRTDAGVARLTYERLKPCLTFDRKYYFNYPRDAEEHFDELKRVSSQFRGLEPHTGQGYYREKWIENYFIDSFLAFPLSNFSGLFPLFVQWTDYDKREHDRDPRMTGRQRASLFKELTDILRPDVMYVTVSQANKGLEAVKRSHPNVLVINAGGEGNIPIPLIKGKIARQPVPNNFSFPLHVGFIGTKGHDVSRIWALDNFQDAIDAHNKEVRDQHGKHVEQGQRRIRFHIDPPSDDATIWQVDMGRTLFNLAPRGFGRATFRLAEVVQIGRLPIYVYDDYPWIPYAGTPAGCDALGFVVSGHRKDLDALVYRIGDLLYGYDGYDGKGREDTVRRLLEGVEKQRYWYTYKGVVKQLQMFFSDPLDVSNKGIHGGGYLRCAHVGHQELVEPLDNNAVMRS